MTQRDSTDAETAFADKQLKATATTVLVSRRETFNAAHELQPQNITYKRQAYSVVGAERSGDSDMGRFRQAPEEGEDWPFVSDFNRDLIAHDPALAKKLGLT